MTDLRRVLLVTIVGMLAELGCSHHPVGYPLSERDRAWLRSELDGRHAVVRFVPAGSSLSVASKTIAGKTFIEEELIRVSRAGATVEVPLDQVREIDANRSLGGALFGATLGLLSGLVVGGIWGYGQGTDCENNRAWAPCFDRSVTAFVGALYLGGVGTVLGLPIGAVAGAGPTWRLQPTADR